MEHVAIEPEFVDEFCPEDQGQLLIRKNKQGIRFIACANFPKCRYTASLENDAENEKIQKRNF
ncbi:UNVERIFIED_CONTAM: topoisomerase DNA-binding C4 zinc finger domain-containing protein [Campylobacter lari]